MSRQDPVTQPQLNFIRALARQVDVPLELVANEAMARFGRSLDTEHLLDRGMASELIDWLQAVRDGHAPRPVPPGQISLFGDGAR